MNSQHRAIRALLTTMAPRRAEAYIRAFELPADETDILILCDVRDQSCTQVADAMHISPETVKRRRKRAYQKIANGIQYTESRS